MGAYEHLIGCEVKVIVLREGRESSVKGTLLVEDDHTIGVRFRSGDIIPIGKNFIVMVYPIDAKKEVK